MLIDVVSGYIIRSSCCLCVVPLRRASHDVRERVLSDAEKTVQMRVEEEEMLQEMLEVVEQRDALVSMLDDDRRL